MAAPLENLYDYTKWHNGIYLTLASGFGVAATTDSTRWPVTFDNWWLGLSAILIGVAGIAGGVVATNTLEFATFDAFMKTVIGPDILIGPARWLQPKDPNACLRRCARWLLCGRRWTNYEHMAFWAGLACAVIALRCGRKPTWYATQIRLGTHEVIQLCIKDEQPQAAKYWDAERGVGVETQGALIWSPLPEQAVCAKPSADRGFCVARSACEHACKEPLSKGETRCAQAATDTSAHRNLGRELASALAPSPAKEPERNTQGNAPAQVAPPADRPEADTGAPATPRREP